MDDEVAEGVEFRSGVCGGGREGERDDEEGGKEGGGEDDGFRFHRIRIAGEEEGVVREL